MTDMIPADAVREIIARHRDGASHRGGMILDDLKALLPRPTLADMTDEERDDCQWMQADVANISERYVIANPNDMDGEVVLVSADGKVEWMYPGYITPRPDLPRLEWPGDPKPAPALPGGWRLADHPDCGRVIVTRTEPDRDGNICFVFPAADPMGYDWDFCRPAELTHIDRGDDQ